jgi:hypothetical protein
MNRRVLLFDGMCKGVAFLWAFMLLSSTPVLALLNVNDLRNKLLEIPQASPAAASRYAADGLALGDQVKFGSKPYQRYQCSPSDGFPGFLSCNEEHKTPVGDQYPDQEVTRSHSVLQSQDGVAYVNSYFEPAFFDPNGIQNEIDRMSSKFGRQARIIQMPQREGLPNAVIAVWGAIQLEPLRPEDISVVASGGSYPGILVSFLGDLPRSAKAGVPVYRLAGGAGFLWAATFDQNGKGVLRYLAIDPSKIVSRQAAPNQPAPASSLGLDSGNQTTSSQGPANPPASNQPAPAPTLSLGSGNQTTSSQGPADLPVILEGADRQRSEVQQLATNSEVAIAIFILLCGLAVAAFLGMKRVRGCMNDRLIDHPTDNP